MEKILFKKIASSFAIAGLLFFIVFSYLFYFIQAYSVENHMDEMLMQIGQAYEKTSMINEKLKRINGLIEDYPSIQAEISQKILQELELDDSLESILHSIPTTYDESLGAIDTVTGKIIGMTTNNCQELNIEGITEKEELIRVLEASHKGKLLKVNGTYQFLKTRRVDDHIILFTLFQSDKFFKEYGVQMFLIGFVIVFFIILLIIELRRYVRKYILKDFLHIEDRVKQLIHGTYDISFETEYDTEIKALSTVLNDWKDSCKYKSQRIIKIINVLSHHVAVFECLYATDNHFFSDNMADILGMSEAEWEEIKRVPYGFEKYIEHLMSAAQENDLIYVNNKIISIKSFKVENEFYGLIVDKTEEIHSAHKREDEMQRMKDTAERDTLTELFNRKVLEKHIEEKFKIQPNEGIMLIFDLDNFKSINDMLGHPEGDKLLKVFSGVLKANFRKKDIIARLGGDEFVVFIDDSLPVSLLERKLNSTLDCLRNELSDYYTEYNISTSIGVAYVDHQMHTYEELYKYADVALYIAKRMGKDRYFINEDNIRCMRGECINCSGDCKKRKVLGL